MKVFFAGLIAVMVSGCFDDSCGAACEKECREKGGRDRTCMSTCSSKCYEAQPDE